MTLRRDSASQTTNATAPTKAAIQDPTVTATVQVAAMPTARMAMLLTTLRHDHARRALENADHRPLMRTRSPRTILVVTPTSDHALT